MKKARTDPGAGLAHDNVPGFLPAAGKAPGGKLVPAQRKTLLISVGGAPRPPARQPQRPSLGRG